MSTLDYEPNSKGTPPPPVALPLDPEERYVLAYLGSDGVRAAWLGWLIAKLLIGAVFIAGFSTDNRALMLTAFLTLLILELYTAAKQPRLTRAICSAVAKLEKRIEELQAAK